jgi:DNA-binding NtrC family response regulator
MSETTIYKILIVEDEPILAYSLEENLMRAGFKIAGTAYKITEALDLINSGITIDAAILDVNLHGISSQPIAVALAKHLIPFIVISGYSLEQIKNEYPTEIFVQKPYKPMTVTKHLQTLLKIT